MTATENPIRERIALLREKQQAAHASGGPEGLRRHRESGRLPVRERIDLLVDPGTWFEIGALALPELRREKPIPGDSALHASTAHYVVMVRSGSIALSGPSVVEPAIGEKVTDAELGGPAAATEAGNAHLVVDTEADAMDALAAFLSYLPQNSAQRPPVAPPLPPGRDPAELERIVPLGARSGYDMRDVFACLADEASVLPWADGWGSSLLCALARIEGRPVGLVGNQPIVRAGALDPAALAKEKAFVQLCDTFGLPLVFLHDVPGLMIGTQAERGGILHGYEALVSAIAEATVPKVGVVLRKAYGGGHFAMGGRPTRPDFLYAWPSAELGFMAPETGIRTIHRRRLEKVLAEQGPEAHAALVAELTAEWISEAEPWEAAAHLSLDDVVEPGRTREVVAASIDIALGGASLGGTL